MLIIPIEQKLDGDNPPVATLLLILINCFVFFGYQAQDQLIWEQAAAIYLAEDLYQYEHKVYIQYLQQYEPESLAEFHEYDEELASYVMMADTGFAEFLDTDYFINNVTELKWMDARLMLDQAVAELSYMKYGFIPGKFSVIDLFTSMFLHGDIGHLLGNMLFLFIYGFSLEIALGRLWYVVIYLLSGIGGDLLTWATAPDSLIPIVGASGAIFGLLGMYLGLYGLRKIRFFFTIGFYVNYFRAPALVLLPYWGLIELYDQFIAQDNIAHYAHLGGLFVGALVVSLAKDRIIKIDRDYVEKIDTEEPFLKDYDQFLRHVENMNILQAKKMLAAMLKAHPKDFRLWKHQYDLWKLQPDSPQFDQAAKAVLSQAKLNDEEAKSLCRIVDEYERISEHQAALTPSVRLNVSEILLGLDELQSAERHLTQILDEPKVQAKLPNLVSRLANRFSARNHQAKATQYAELIIQRFPDSDAAQQMRLLVPESG